MTVYAPHDFETGSAVDLKKSNADVYAQDPSTHVHCMAWAIGDGPVSVWKPGDPDPVEFLDHIRDGGMLSAWNSYFEESLWRWVIPRTHPHWPIPTTEQFDDTMARALAAGLPGGLADAAEAVALGQDKDKTGHRVMMQCAKPKELDEYGRPIFRTPKTDPEKFEHLYSYCAQDVEAERTIAKVLPPLIPRERQLWLLDQKINRRGIAIDRKGVEGAIRLIKRETQRLNDEISTLTDGAVPTISAVPKLKTWLTTQGITVESLNKAGIIEILKQELLPDNVRRVLEIRQEAGKASVAKLNKILSCADPQNRLPANFAFHRATTGRWGGRGVQLQNLARPRLSAPDIAECIELFQDDELGRDLIQWGYGDPFSVVSWSTRGLLVPAPGHRFIGGDFSNIEGRVLAWLAGETWKTEAFKANDAGHGSDLYKLAYARAFNVDPDTIGDDDRRQIGKVMELALGYQGGVGAFRTMAITYGMKLSELADQVESATDPEIWEAAEKKRQWLQIEKGQHADLPGRTYTALRVLVDAWRATHPHVTTFWADCESAAMSAIFKRGEQTTTFNNMLRFVCGRHFLYCKLPSGRVLYYARPSIEVVWSELFEQRQKVIQYYASGKEKNGADKNTGPKKFAPVHSYGGLLAQNATQAVARDILGEALIRLETANYPVVLHVHDEARAEVPNDFGSPEECADIMGFTPDWAQGLPVKVGCEIMHRYHK